MSLPKISAPIYTITLPFSKSVVKISPYLVADEKAMLMAKESNNMDDMIATLKSVLKRCTHGFDIEQLVSCDLDYLFIQLQIKSRGSLRAMRYTCKKIVDGVACDQVTPFEMNLSGIQLSDIPEKGKDRIPLTETIGVMMRYPGWDTYIMTMNKPDLKTQDFFQYVGKCIKYVYDGDNIITDFSEDEIENWLGTLSEAQFTKIAEFFKAIPKLYLDQEIACRKCRQTEKIRVEGIQNFLA